MHGDTAQSVNKGFQPYLCFGFKIQEQIVYLSDVSHIPDDAWDIICPPQTAESRLPVCILDCLNLRTHPSHIGMKDAVELARRIDARRTYLVGFSHEVSHNEYVTIGEAVGGKMKEQAEMTENEIKGVGLIGEGDYIWLRPAHDGLRVHVGGKDIVGDETYDTSRNAT